MNIEGEGRKEGTENTEAIRRIKREGRERGGACRIEKERTERVVREEVYGEYRRMRN